MSQSVEKPSKARGYITTPNPRISNYFKHRFDIDLVTWSPDALEDPVVLVFSDGPPVSPTMWGDKINRSFNLTYAPRLDMRERRAFTFTDSNVPKVGFGRGACFLNVMNYGTLWHKVNGHTDKHDIRYQEDGEIESAQSNHHQAIIRSQVIDSVILAKANTTTDRRSASREIVSIDPKKTALEWLDIEGLYYPATSSLCWLPLPSHYSIQTKFDKILGKFLHTGDI